MAKKDRKRGNRRNNRHERRQEQQSGGGGWDCINKPDGLEVFKPEAKQTYNIDVLPYIVGPRNKNADEGDEYFELSYAVYNDLGIEEKRYIAIGEMLGERDPVAEHFAQLRKQNAEWDDMKNFKPKWRQLMLIFVHEEADKGLQLFEGAYGTLGELLDEEISGEEEDYIDNFDDPDGGATLEVRFKAKNIGMKNPWVMAAKINFEHREYGFNAGGDEKLAAELLEQAGGICLDDCLKIVDYDTLKAALDGAPVGNADTGDSSDAPEEKPAPRRGRKPKAETTEDEIPDLPEEKAAKKPAKKAKKQPTAASLGIEKGGEVEHDEHGPCTVLRIAKDGLTVTILDAEDEVHKGVDPTDLEPIEEVQEEEAPAKETKKPAKAKKKEEKAPEEPEEPADTSSGDGKADDWDDDWED